MVDYRVQGKPHITMPTKRHPVFNIHFERDGWPYFAEFNGPVKDLTRWWPALKFPHYQPK